MAWETRKRGGRYYTRSRRLGGRVVREYVGSGPFAEAVAALDEEVRVAKKAMKQRSSAELARTTRIDDFVASQCAKTTQTVSALLIAKGFYRHNRGEWRKRRG